MITNSALLKWLDAYINPSEWVIELTGGEPGLYPEIGTLIPELAARGFSGVVKTNGSLPIPKSANFQLVAAWHLGEEIPRHYDQIVIIENPDDNWQEKAEYCKENGIAYKTVIFDRQFEGQKTGPLFCKFNKVVNSMHINSSGQITPCASVKATPQTIFNMSPPAIKEVAIDCPRCKNMNDVERFLPEDMIKKFANDFDNWQNKFSEQIPVSG
jgi:MoaA/NifB/PqqE/SkfB family radical SAM enzyme